MDIQEIDKNFQIPNCNRENIRWIDAREFRNGLFGIFYDEKLGRYFRLPQAIADTVNPGVKELCRHTAGGRLRFKTDSDFVAIKAVIDDCKIMYNMPVSGSQGFGLYVNNEYAGILSPSFREETADGNTRAFCAAVYHFDTDMKSVDLYFPLYNGVKQLFVGVRDCAIIKEAEKYTYEKPVVFYGSSITQGGCASHPGNDYEGHLSRWLSFDYINLGFSGNGLGEAAIAEYIATIDASVFVIDYDHNAPDVEHLRNTHYPFYQTIRAHRPEVPIIFASRPDWLDGSHIARRNVIYETYRCAQEQGDAFVWFLDGKKLFGKGSRDACTVDLCHPNDLGFLRMAKAFYPLLSDALKHRSRYR